MAHHLSAHAYVPPHTKLERFYNVVVYTYGCREKLQIICICTDGLWAVRNCVSAVRKYCVNRNRHNTTQHNTNRYNTTQHKSVQHNTTQHKSVQHNTTQIGTTQHNTTQQTQQDTTQHNTTQHNTTHKLYAMRLTKTYSNQQTTCSTVLLGKPTAPQPVSKCVTGRFIAVCTTAQQLCIS